MRPLDTPVDVLCGEQHLISIPLPPPPGLPAPPAACLRRTISHLLVCYMQNKLSLAADISHDAWRPGLVWEPEGTGPGAEKARGAHTVATRATFAVMEKRAAS